MDSLEKPGCFENIRVDMTISFHSGFNKLPISLHIHGVASDIDDIPYL